MQFHVVQSFEMLDLSDMALPMIVVFNQNTLDFPGKYVARVWEGKVNLPTNCVVVGDTYEEIESSIPPRFHNLGRNPGDRPNIIEVWV